MYFPVPNRLLQGMVASVLVLAGTAACSRSDRTESGSSNAAGVMHDTLKPAGNNAPGATASSDTSVADTSSSSPVTATRPAAGDTARTSVSPNTPRAATASPTTERQDASSQTDSGAPAYRAMERDTATAPVESDSARVTADTSETSLDTSDTTSAGYVEMARDTTTTGNQIDTTATVADTAGTIRVAVETDPTELDEVNSSETADEELVNSAEETSAPDRETVTAAENRTDEVGAAAMGGTVTAREAVALMTRQGAQCALIDPESNEAVRWDMASTPVTLNPCGMGSMNLSKVGTEAQGGSGAAGQ